MINILVANDDGIEAEGIRRLVKALSEVANVYVVAPMEQQSAKSQALSLGRQIRVAKRNDIDGATLAYEVDGTPADCVKMGLDVIARNGIKIDAVYSGINHGGNLGSDTMYSGTVSAAAEGAFLDLPAVAVSVNSHNPRYFDKACELAVEILPRIMKEHIKGSVININTPDLPSEEIKGVKAANLGNVEYDTWFELVKEEGEELYYQYTGVPLEVESWTEDMDTWLIRRGYATLSAIYYDLNHKQGLELIKKWGY